MFDEEVEKPKGHVVGHSLETLSVDELEAYIVDLENEIKRVQDDIEKKKTSRSLADSVFSS
jgi:uncharacterized small protein (DUF1192 family)